MIMYLVESLNVERVLGLLISLSLGKTAWLYQQGRLCQLGSEFCELEVFAKVLRALDKRHLLHHCFQALMDHGVKVASVLAYSFSRRCSYIAESDAAVKEKAIQIGHHLEDLFYLFLRLLHVRNGNCKYHLGEETFKLAQSYMDKLAKHGQQANKAALYGELCALLFAKSHYDEAYKWCIEAMKEITVGLPVKVVVDVLRQASKACVVKREFKKAEQLIKHAVYLAREHFGAKHPKYSDTLLDYGFYLLNVDNICQSVAIYQTALDIRQSVFGGKNIHVATAHEDLAYSSYVHQYSSGKFDNALCGAVGDLMVESLGIAHSALRGEGKKLFGEGYSGLEYDYRGLIKLYNSIGNYEKVFEYHNILANWNRLRDRQFSVTDALEDVSTSPQSTEEVVQSFLMSQNVDGQSS
ncbi:hypothetical protein llap_18304 [Limosa lapponica baueri]|uniref:Amyloid protein-binding protein 2 n=1 Tax=Limosa lapponica baueri TaxID=1758121 RepID=A0A2I0TCA1_LIMLA|nr:hypothetical protein llap_18304 [Limosa lapponica baueri]